jgi:hypothetical protein
MLRIENGVSLLCGNVAQQVYFINETVISDKLK